MQVTEHEVIRMRNTTHPGRKLLKEMRNNKDAEQAEQEAKKAISRINNILENKTKEKWIDEPRVSIHLRETKDRVQKRTVKIVKKSVKKAGWKFKYHDGYLDHHRIEPTIIIW